MPLILLVRQGLITVSRTNVAGNCAPSASRKTRFGRLYFSLGPLLETTTDIQYPKTRNGKAGATKDSLDKRNLNKWERTFESASVREGTGGWHRVGDFAKSSNT